MVFLVIRLISLFAVLLLAYGFVTQWALPTIRGTKTFPYFRSKNRDALRRIEDARTERLDSELLQKALEEESDLVKTKINSNNDIIEKYDSMIDELDKPNKHRVSEEK